MTRIIPTKSRGYKIYIDDALVAVAEETQQGFQSITFRGIHDRKELASSVLQDRHFHGQYLCLENHGDGDDIYIYMMMMMMVMVMMVMMVI